MNGVGVSVPTTSRTPRACSMPTHDSNLGHTACARRYCAGVQSAVKLPADQPARNAGGARDNIVGSSLATSP